MDSIKATENFAAWKIEPLPSPPKDLEAFYRHLVGWAILAANSHNVQPWRFRFRPDLKEIDIFVHPDGILPASDKLGRQAHISTGCAVANLLAAAKAYQYAASVILRGEKFPKPVATVKVGQGTQPFAPTSKVFLAMQNRRVNRSQYESTKPAPKEFIDRATTAATTVGVKISFIKDFATKAAIAEIQYLADRSVVARHEFRHELGQFFLPNDSEKSVGMPGNTFGLTDETTKSVIAALEGKGSFDPDLAHGFAASGRDGIKSAPLLVIISVDKDQSTEWVRAGMAFEEIALIAEELGLSIAVHAAMVEVTMFNKLLQLRLATSGCPMMIFRVGYSGAERPHSPRLAPDQVII